LLAFPQPFNFSIPPQYASYVAAPQPIPSNRLNFPLQQFINDTKLGQPVAANWFREAPSIENPALATTCSVRPGNTASASASASALANSTTTTSTGAVSSFTSAGVSSGYEANIVAAGIAAIGLSILVV
jgi:phosphatidylethanolamine-binding protein